MTLRWEPQVIHFPPARAFPDRTRSPWRTSRWFLLNMRQNRQAFFFFLLFFSVGWSRDSTQVVSKGFSCIPVKGSGCKQEVAPNCLHSNLCVHFIEEKWSKWPVRSSETHSFQCSSDKKNVHFRNKHKSNHFYQALTLIKPDHWIPAGSFLYYQPVRNPVGVVLNVVFFYSFTFVECWST